MKQCKFCKESFKKPYNYSYKQYEDQKYCSRSCSAKGESDTIDQYLIKFWRKVDVSTIDKCWEYLGPKCEKGYGMARKYRGGTIRAHRLSYELYFGNKIDSDILACHICDNPSCVNPHHIFLGTNQDNCDDKIRKGRQRVLKGSETARSKLNEDDVYHIFKSKLSAKKLAYKYNVSKSTIYAIKSGQNWKHLTDNIK